jgi:undecaprenyl-diphosphatase
LLGGGILLVYIDRVFKKPVVETDDQLSYTKSFIIGCWQVISMIPGISRSAATIIGGMQQKLTRNVAAEFSFYLAVPTMFAASAYSLFLKKWMGSGVEKKGYELITESQANIVAFVVGNIVAFIVALLAIKFFINFLKIYGFKVFGIYRIIVGVFLLILIYAGYLK